MVPIANCAECHYHKPDALEEIPLFLCTLKVVNSADAKKKKNPVLLENDLRFVLLTSCCGQSGLNSRKKIKLNMLYDLHCTILFCSVVLYCIVLYCVVLYCIVLYCVVLCCIVLCCIVLYCIVLCCVVLCCIVLCCIVLYCVVLYCVVSCRIIYLCFTSSFTPSNDMLCSTIVTDLV